MHNVHDYGAVGDGVSPDEAAIQSAVDAAIRDGGDVVLFPGNERVDGASGCLGGPYLVSKLSATPPPTNPISFMFLPGASLVNTGTVSSSEHVFIDAHESQILFGGAGTYSIGTRGTLYANWFAGSDPASGDFSPRFNKCLQSCRSASTIRCLGEHDVKEGLDASAANGGSEVTNRVYDFRGSVFRVVPGAKVVLNLTGTRDVRVLHFRTADGLPVEERQVAVTGILAARAAGGREAAHNHFLDCMVHGRFSHGCVYIYRQENLRFERCRFHNLEPNKTAVYATKWNDNSGDPRFPWQGVAATNIARDTPEEGTTTRLQFQTCDFRTECNPSGGLHVHHCSRLSVRDCYCRNKDGLAAAGVFIDQQWRTGTYGVNIEDVWSEGHVIVGVQVTGITPIVNLSVTEHSIGGRNPDDPGQSDFFAFEGRHCQILGLRIDAVRSVRFTGPVTPNYFVYNAKISVTLVTSIVDLRGLYRFSGRIQAHPDQPRPVRPATNMLPADVYS